MYCTILTLDVYGNEDNRSLENCTFFLHFFSPSISNNFQLLVFLFGFHIKFFRINIIIIIIIGINNSNLDT